MAIITPTPVDSLYITFPQLLTIIAFLISIMTVWIAFRIRVARMEVKLATSREETDLKITALSCQLEIKLKGVESKAVSAGQFIGARIEEFIEGNKEEHNRIESGVDKVLREFMVNHKDDHKRIENDIEKIAISVDGLKGSINNLSVEVAKRTPYQHDNNKKEH